MKLRTFYKTGILFLFYLLATHNSHAQKKSSLELGVQLMAEANSAYGSVMPLTGVQFIYQKGKHSGFETGLYYRTARFHLAYSIYDPSSGYQSGDLPMSERFISIPVLYRFNSRVLNFAAGPSFDLFLNWKAKNNKSPVSVTRNKNPNSIEVGAVASVSKSFLFGDKWVLEPAVRFNPIFTEGDPYVNSALGFSLRYKLN